MKLQIEAREHNGLVLCHDTTEVPILFGSILVSTSVQGSMLVSRLDETGKKQMGIELTPQAIAEAVLMAKNPSQMSAAEKLEALALLMQRLGISFKTTLSIDCVDDEDDRQGEANWDLETQVVVSGKEIAVESETGYHDNDANVEILFGADEFRQLAKSAQKRDDSKEAERLAKLAKWAEALPACDMELQEGGANE